ncbi:S49 family peptidase [Salipiger sp. IMCC34102]|uniref:S49 family peptidase n=1 Tax=Salipiger sp. IMCC34102 TaxID=2510647 RepID=UPI00101D46B1|nr:S49 family peptidase [Salipiger sp. IMCC34102]RYH02002.1 S49 family peptidase [Salipiger sp. IMCC34102]
MKNLLPFLNADPRVNVVRLQGTITTTGRGLDDATLAPVLQKAFTRGKPRAVALQINCPGGSPVQSSLIAARIRRLSVEKEVPVYAFVEDVAASGGYWLACAADEIHADVGSLLGSIGVISAGFGLHAFIDRHGVERRVHTAGASKSMLDPFRPEKPEDVDRLKSWLTQLHEVFIAYVKSRREAQLDDDPALFTGEVWIGERAREKGLIDGIGHLVPVMKGQFGDKVRFRKFGPKKSLFSRLGARMMGEAVGQIEDRAAFARFGL